MRDFVYFYVLGMFTLVSLGRDVPVRDTYEREKRPRVAAQLAESHSVRSALIRATASSWVMDSPRDRQS